MVKQRNIFDPEQIDILTDEIEKEVNAAKLTQREIIEAHNRGAKCFGIPKSQRKGHSDLPLFKPENQTSLF
jgi:hypothetical protein